MDGRGRSGSKALPAAACVPWGKLAAGLHTVRLHMGKGIPCHFSSQPP